MTTGEKYVMEFAKECPEWRAALMPAADGSRDRSLATGHLAIWFVEKVGKTGQRPVFTGEEALSLSEQFDLAFKEADYTGALEPVGDRVETLRIATETFTFLGRLSISHVLAGEVVAPTVVCAAMRLMLKYAELHPERAGT